MGIDKNTEFIEAYLKGQDVDVFGVGDMSFYDKELVALDNSLKERLTFGISFGLVLSKGILETLTDGPTLIYLHHYRQLNYRLDMAAYLLSREIERKGFVAMPFAASQLVDWKDQRAHISHKKVGEIAGVGWIGRNNLLVHPVFGAQVRYNTVLTDMPLDAGKPLGKDCGQCRACISACPAGAIREEKENFDHQGCYLMLNKFKKERNLGHHICGICIRACRGER
ncbi:MAG TPA: hypothetical protein PLX02_05325 [Syntrophorhabdaceae bacterium]|nr:hypothetical protein [Syntrophorhabdaceae bacterium]HQM81025.1 hypothetical protein [Syntrophorhabdaceae bacterium]